MKILILKPSSLGDVVQALPVLRLLKQHYRDSEVYWWVEKRNASLLEGDPDLAGLFLFDRERWARPQHLPEIWRAVSALRHHRFDLVIDLQALARSGIMGWLANGRHYAGLMDGRELAHGFYDIAVPRPSPTTHAVDWYLAVLRVLGVPVHSDFEWLPTRPGVASEVTSWFSGSVKPLVALLPGARWDNKRWPSEYFRDVVHLVLAARADVEFVVLGGKSDSSLAKNIAQESGAVRDLTGKTSLPQMIEVLRRAAVVVTNDTGPMHVAAALRKPVVGIFGPTNPARTGAYGQLENSIQRTDLPCVPCMKSTCGFREPLACLRGIFPQRVATEVLKHL